jgi:hypothetical protein
MAPTVTAWGKDATIYKSDKFTSGKIKYLLLISFVNNGYLCPTTLQSFNDNFCWSSAEVGKDKGNKAAGEYLK